MFLDLFLGGYVCFIVIFDNTLLLKLLQGLYYIVLAIPMGSRVVDFNSSHCAFEYGKISRIDVIYKDTSCVTVAGCWFARDDISLEVRGLAYDLVDLMLRIEVQRPMLVITGLGPVHSNEQLWHGG